MEDVIIDLADRWRRARKSALQKLRVVDESIEQNQKDAPELTEEELLGKVLSVSPEKAQQSVFENSLKLGQGFAKFYRNPVAFEQVQMLLSAMAVPCLHGEWTRAADEPTLFLERSGCGSTTRDKAYCDYWREAISGLVLGLTGSIRHTRHASFGYGSQKCFDVIHEKAESKYRFGTLSEEMKEPLDRIVRSVKRFNSGIEINFLGVSEGVLLYQVDRSKSFGDVSIQTVLERHCKKAFPSLTLLEINPTGVLDDRESSCDDEHEHSHDHHAHL